MTITTPLSGTICRRCAGTSYETIQQQCIKSEISTFTHYEDIKGDEKCRNWGGCGLRVTQGHRQHSHSIENLRLQL